MTTTAPAHLAQNALQRLLPGLQHPDPLPDTEPWHGESLASGAAGTALIHIENARTEPDPQRQAQRWDTAHRWVQAAGAAGVSTSDTCGLFLGAPAVAFTVHTAGRYRATAPQLLRETVALTHRRVDNATKRLDTEETATFAEYDALFGLTGLGTLLLATAPGENALERVLSYLVALTRPRTVQGCTVPGWWVSHDPHRGASELFPGGHANLGMAHGMAGILALLATAKRAGVTVDGHDEAILLLLEHLEDWAQEGPAGPWWPEHLSLNELASGLPHPCGPARPSWCYGTPGIVRAGQLAALALGDRSRQAFFEHALDRCLSDESQLARVIDAGLCHGWAGLFQTTWRATAEAPSPHLTAHLPRLTRALVTHAKAGTRGQGLLEGNAGTALALMTATTDTAPATGWDTCLLIV